MLQLVLASESPRRKFLLEEAGFSFYTFPVKVSETIDKNLTSTLTIDAQIMKIAERKAEAALTEYKPSKSGRFLVLAADTMVVFANTPLGKPKNSTQAFEFLRLLSGQLHEVKTALLLIEAEALSQNGTLVLSRIRQFGEVTTTKVQFRDISDDEIINYISTGEPMDKAGAYGIQGLGGRFVEKIIGPYDNVVGLPIASLKNALTQMNWSLTSP